MLVAGATVGKYVLVRELGSGGMGVVWAARDPDLDREVALKLLRRADADPDLRKRLLREARAMARLKHPNVLTVYEVGSEGDRDFIAIELIDGSSLDTWLAGTPPRKQVIAALLAAGAGLEAAHDAGLVHRDFKPHNVLRSSAGTVRVTDFGLARNVTDGVPFELVPPSDQRPSDPLLDSTLTQTGAVLGTPAYMAPEQFDGAVADQLSDQFAFCVTVWQALSGTRPYKGTTLEELRRAIGARERGDASRIPRLVRRVLVRGLDPDPKRRWPNMRVLLRQLSHAFALPRRAAFAAAGATLVAGVAIAVVATRPDATRETVYVAKGACEDPNRAFDAAWPATTRAAIADRLAKAGYPDTIPRWLDDLRKRWTATYVQTCANPDRQMFHAQLSCMLGARDSVASLVDLMTQLPINELGTFDVFGVAPQFAACTSSTPPTPPSMPSDRATRDKIAAIRARAHALIDSPQSTLAAATKQLEAEARTIGWSPLVAHVLYSAGVAANYMQAWNVAHDVMPRAAMEAVASRDPGLEAQARIDRYEIAGESAENPRDDGELARLAGDARAAIRAAGDDPAQRAALDIMEARVAVVQHEPDRALAQPTAARDAFLTAGDYARAALAVRWMVTAYLARDRDGDVEAAAALVDDTRKRLEAAHATGALKLLAHYANEVAWRRNRLTDCADSGCGEYNMQYPEEQDSMFQRRLHGRVVEPDGRPASNAGVMAWHGTLEGNATTTGPGLAMESGSDGDWGSLPTSGSVIVSRDDLRTIVPHPHDNMTIQLRPTHSVRGSVVTAAGSTRAWNVDGCVLVPAGPGDLWIERAPVMHDGTFEITRVPEGNWQLCATNGTRRVHGANGVVHWPAGPTLDVIVRGATGEPTVWVFRGRVDPKTFRDADALARTAADLGLDTTQSIGQAKATAAGRAQYKPDDTHALFRDNAPGLVSVCAAQDSDDHPAVTCTHYDIKPGADAQAVVVALH
jgi:predicted Ser/Thr protein kinase